MPLHPIDRRAFLATAGSALAATTLGAAPAIAVTKKLRPPHGQIEELTFAELRRGLETGRWTARALAEAYLERVEEIDRAGPTLRSVIEVNPDALRIADELDAARRAGRVRGPLHGIPIMLKDNIDTGDAMLTTAGSLALAGAPASRDAFVARQLREAGALILGKTNLSEWANFRSTQSSSGWSARGGQCRNPYVLDRSPCGSSSGSGAAPSANLCAGAVGTETDGSVVCPASANSLVGIKPTVGLVSRTGIVPISHSQDTAGPMARSVADAAALLSAMAGADPRDVATANARREADYTRFLDAGGLRGARLGVVRERLMGYSPEADRLMEAAIVALRDAGAEIVDSLEIPNQREVGGAEWQVLLYEFKHDLNAYLDTRTGVAVRTLADVIAFNDANAEREMPWFGQEIFLQAQEKGGLETPEYVESAEKAKRLAGPEGIDALMAEHRLDALVAPTDSPPWTIDLVNGDHYMGGASTAPAVAGYPHITVPMGYTHGLPVGLSFFGRAWSEPVLIRLAYAYEQATKLRRQPVFRATLVT